MMQDPFDAPYAHGLLLDEPARCCVCLKKVNEDEAYLERYGEYVCGEDREDYLASRRADELDIGYDRMRDRIMRETA